MPARLTVALGTGIATPRSMTANPLALAPVDVGARRAMDLLVLDRVKIQAWDRILFVQCGDGWIVEEAWRRAVRAYICGLDMSGVDVALARQLREVPGKLEFKTWDGQSLPVPDRAFDRVVAILAPGQVQAAALVRDLGRVLRSDGDAYVLHPVSADRDVRQALAQAGWTDVRELARSGDESAVLVHARGSSLPPRAGPD